LGGEWRTFPRRSSLIIPALGLPPAPGVISGKSPPVNGRAVERASTIGGEDVSLSAVGCNGTLFAMRRGALLLKANGFSPEGMGRGRSRILSVGEVGCEPAMACARATCEGLDSLLGVTIGRPVNETLGSGVGVRLWRAAGVGESGPSSDKRDREGESLTEGIRGEGGALKGKLRREGNVWGVDEEAEDERGYDDERRGVPEEVDARGISVSAGGDSDVAPGRLSSSGTAVSEPPLVLLFLDGL
jgi:hypothetical protein